MRSEIGIRAANLPASASWRHIGTGGARQGFEVAFLRRHAEGFRFDGHTCAMEDGEAWAVRYHIVLDDGWATREARIWAWSAAGEHDTRLDADGTGHWAVDGSSAAQLDGCLDIDLESSALTNMFPVHRLNLGVGDSASPPAAYVRALDPRVERLEQDYTRVTDDGSFQRYDYGSPQFDFECRLVYDQLGLVVDYPGIATRVT